MIEDDDFDPVPLAQAIAMVCGLALLAIGRLGLVFA